MDDWSEDAYPVIFDEQDRERDSNTPTANTQSKYCCPVLLVFIIIALIIAL